MKTGKRLQILLFGSALLSTLAGCGPNNENKILVPTIINESFSEENAFIPLTYELTKAFLESKKSFILYAGSPRCTHCINLMPSLLEYIESSKVEIYYLNSLTATYQENYGYFLEELDLKATPTFLFIKEGKVIHREVGTRNLKTTVNIVNLFKKYVYTNNYVHINLPETAINYPDKYVTFSYNFSSVEAQKIINTHFYPLFSEKNYNIYISDERENENSLLLTYGAETTSTNLINGSDEEISEARATFIDYFK
jgi:predicted bacteriocin transport accessory protein